MPSLTACGAYDTGKLVVVNRRENSNFNLVLRIKLRLGKKLCKLQARFLATVNNVNYTVNYK